MTQKIDITPQRVRAGLVAIRDQIRQPLYDSITFFNNADQNIPFIGTQQFFTNIQGKTLDETNMTLSGQLETKTSFLVQGVQFNAQNFYTDNAGILPILIDNSSISLEVTEKQYLEVPLDYVAGKLDAWRQPDSYVSLGAAFGNAIVYDPFTVFTLEPNQSFRVDWTVETPSALQAAVLEAGIAVDSSLRVYAMILGIQRRRVQ